mmetsp:Transcript_14219/g.38134  ORF Transcript_14219/g.38134 Transcript_14219/m.38134 type:complete len:361 (+) Transcript_14219:75-1157(+)|eukprot:CAMPEP_0185837552 /NCGR_PEP_ID=MMETSP1353-20130828/11595_1 /TAXON_ID=1077150 /ORGANISM="Erythrolobus australicus, Strain CCMP3124" /LENGTH=360 /DNA_ID=CAMNT_0028536481 /DNA_START=404 /DNA_END=1486 /DNA_ORIENTATION=+
MATAMCFVGAAPCRPPAVRAGWTAQRAAVGRCGGVAAISRCSAGVAWTRGVRCGRRLDSMRACAMKKMTEAAADSADSLLCPRCRSSLEAAGDRRLECKTCTLSVPLTDNTYFDLSREEERERDKGRIIFPITAMVPPPATTIFMSPLVSYAYERGWRQQFEEAGFPGPAREFEMLLDFVSKSKLSVRTSVDLSCGSGFMARLMVARSEVFGRVFGVDASASMLRESASRTEKAQPSKPVWVKANAQAIPFADKSVDLVHAGAALHCWAQLPDVLDEIYRILSPGGVFFATTFAEPNVPARGSFSAASRQLGSFVWKNTFRSFGETEMRWLLRGARFQERDIRVERINNCLIVYATKRKS